jgi:hypothetical protein
MVHGDAKRDRTAIAGELLDRARDERVALLDVDGFGKLRLCEVGASGRQSRQVRRGGDAIAPERREKARVDQIQQRARVHDLLEHAVEAEPVASRHRRGEAEQRARPVGLERTDRAQHALVVLRRRVMALVIDDEPEVSPCEHVTDPIGVQRAQRRDEHLRIRGGARAATLEPDDASPFERPRQLVDRLGEELLAMREHEHLLVRQPCEVREDDRLAGACRQTHDHPAHAAPARRDHRVDRLALIEAELGRGHRGTLSPTSDKSFAPRFRN